MDRTLHAEMGMTHQRAKELKLELVAAIGDALTTEGQTVGTTLSKVAALSLNQSEAAWCGYMLALILEDFNRQPKAKPKPLIVTPSKEIIRP